jgi:DNA repair exonuclease SbcCD ATPase subunit
MRIKKISIENFRCFRQAEIDLSSDIVAIYGRNGVGKTSIFDAVEFALIGNIGRYNSLDAQTEYLRNVFVEKNAKVRIDFENQSPKWIEIEKNSNNIEQELQIKGSGGVKNQRDFLYEFLVKESYRTPRHEVSSIAELIRSTMLLSQDTIKDFIEGDSEKRGRIITNMSGYADIQRCLEKTEKVEKVANGRLLEEDNKLQLLQTLAKDLENKIKDKKERILAYENQLSSEREPACVTISQLVNKLALAKIQWQLIEEPVTAEEVDNLSINIGEACQDRFDKISKISNDLVGLETMALQHKNRENRFVELDNLVKKQGQDLIDKQKIEKELSNEIAVSLREKEQLEQNIKFAIRDAEDLQSLPSLRLQRDMLGNKVKQIKQELDQAIEKQQRFNEFLAKAENTVESIVKEIGDLKNAIEKENIWLEKKRKLKREFPKYLEARKELEAIVREKSLLKEEESKIQEELIKLRKEYQKLEKELAELNYDLSKNNTIIDATKKLLSKLRELSRGSKCPLCGHDHSKPHNLQQAISEQLKNIPDSVRVILGEIQKKQNELENIRKYIVDARNKIALISKKGTEYKKVHEISTALINNIEAEAMALSVELSDIDLEGLIESSLSLIRDRQANLSKLETRLKTESVYLKDSKVQLQIIDKDINSKIMQTKSQENELKAAELRISQLGLAEPEKMSNEYIQNEIEIKRNNLTAIENKKKMVIDNLLRKQNEQKLLSDELKDIQKVGNDLQKEYRQLAIELEKYKNKCKESGLSGLASIDDIESKRKDILKEQDALNELLKIVQEYKWYKKTKILEAEMSQEQQLLLNKQNEIAICLDQIKKINIANEKINQWKDLFNTSVGGLVEKTIGRLLPDIQRFFKAMIPSPYLFDEIIMTRKSTGIDLNIKYREINTYSGEPKFFLSSAQANVLALAIFLTLTSKQTWSKLETVMLDDPVQHLDDLDAVAFLDAIRSLALGHYGKKKQIIISTCDPNLYLLMLRKYSLIEKAGVTFSALSITNNGGDPEINTDLRR